MKNHAIPIISIFISLITSNAYSICGLPDNINLITTYGTMEYCQTIDPSTGPTHTPPQIIDKYGNVCCPGTEIWGGNDYTETAPGQLCYEYPDNYVYIRYRNYAMEGRYDGTCPCNNRFWTGYWFCISVIECPDGYEWDSDGEKCIESETEPPVIPPHPDDPECESGGGTTHRFYRSQIHYKEIPSETIISMIISSFLGDKTCITYYKTSYWDICCDLGTIPTTENLNSGYMPDGCYTIKSDMHLQYGDSQAIYTDTYTTPWTEYDPAAEVGLSSDMCPWVTGEYVDTDGDGIPNYLDDDIDGDGIANRYDPDVDGDGILNGADPDVDGDGVPNTIDIDIDGDFIPNHLDDDIDGDGLLNEDDPDADGDGILNEDDDTPLGPVDEDGNGMPDSLENPDDINGDEDQEDYNSSDFAITEDFLVGDDFDQYMEPEEIDVDTSELEALKDNYGMTLYNLNCQLHVTGDLGVVGTLDQTINFCPWEQSLIAIGYVLVAFSGLLCLFRTFS